MVNKSKARKQAREQKRQKRAQLQKQQQQQLQQQAQKLDDQHSSDGYYDSDTEESQVGAGLVESRDHSPLPPGAVDADRVVAAAKAKPSWQHSVVTTYVRPGDLVNGMLDPTSFYDSDSDDQNPLFEGLGDSSLNDEGTVTGIRGMANMGNTCYLNASFQALLHIPQLRSYFLHVYFRGVRQQEKTTIDTLFNQINQMMWLEKTHRRSPISTGITKVLANYVWSKYRIQVRDQHDAHEFLRSLLDDLHESLKVPRCVGGSEAELEEGNYHDGEVAYSPAKLNEPNCRQCHLLFMRQKARNLIVAKEHQYSDYFNMLDEFVELAEGVDVEKFIAFKPDDDDDSVIAVADDVSNLAGRRRRRRRRPMMNGSMHSTPSSSCSSHRSPSHSGSDGACNSASDRSSQSAPAAAAPSPSRPIEFTSIIHDLFQFEMEQTFRCTRCNKVSAKIEKFQDLSIPISILNAVQSQGTGTLGYSSLVRSTTKLLTDRINPNNANRPTSQPVATGYGLRATFNWAMSMVRICMNLFFNYLATTLMQPQIKIEDCISKYFSPEPLENSNQYSCENCGRLTNGVKRSQLRTVPEVLMISLNRYEASRHRHVRKIVQQATYPIVELDLGEFVSRRRRNRKRAGHVCGDSENCSACSSVTEDEEDGDDDDDKDASKKNEENGAIYLYDLIAIVCHVSNNAAFGHYGCYALNDQDDNWYWYNDASVTQVSTSQVLSAGKDAYIFFYRRQSSTERTSAKETALQVAYDIENLYLNHKLDRRACPRPEKDYYLLSVESQALQRCEQVKFFSNLTNQCHLNRRSFAVAKHWLNKLENFYHPGAINNSDFLCKHGAVRPTELLFYNSHTVSLLEPVGQFLWYFYGGGPIFRKSSLSSSSSGQAVCRACQDYLLRLRLKRAHELRQFHRLAGVQGNRIYFQMHKLNFLDKSIIVSNVIDSSFADFANEGSPSPSPVIEEVDSDVRPVPQQPQQQQQVSSNGDDDDADDPSDDDGIMYLMANTWLEQWSNLTTTEHGKTAEITYQQLRSYYKKLLLQADEYSRAAGDADDPKNAEPYRHQLCREVTVDMLHAPLALSMHNIVTESTALNPRPSLERLWSQIDADHHTIRPPGAINNWELFDTRRRLVTELNKVSEELVAACHAGDWLKLRILFLNALGKVKVCEGVEEARYQFKLSNDQYKTEQANRFCKFGLVSRKMWQFFTATYSGGPAIMFDITQPSMYYLNLQKEDIRQFLYAQYRLEVAATSQQQQPRLPRLLLDNVSNHVGQNGAVEHEDGGGEDVLVIEQVVEEVVDKADQISIAAAAAEQ